MLKRSLYCILPLLAFFVCVEMSAKEKLKVSSLFSDNMVVQRDGAIPVWGKSQAGEEITVKFNGKQANAKSDKSGKWQVELPSMEAGGPYSMEISSGEEKISFENVMVGDVWLCSGQSNMQMGLGALKYENILEINGDKLLRLKSGRKPWEKSLGNDKKFTAVGYLFGLELAENLKIPIGLIQYSVGGSRIESWIPEAAVSSRDDLKYLLENTEKDLKDRHKTGRIWQGIISHELPKFPIKGVIWYQGENNVKLSHNYAKLLQLMILEWRRQWQRNLAFGIVQLPRMGKASMEPADSLWAELRESQTKALELPNTALAVMIDSGDNDNLHPWNKRLTGHRLFTAVLGKIYQKQKVYTGPSFKNAEFSDGKAVIEFDHTGSGLIARSFDIEVATAPDGTPMDKEYIIKGFTIAGKDRVFHPASAKITNNKITVWSPDVKAPQAVRYAWNDNPDGLNLFNLEGFPVAPFRTDNWPVLTNNSQLKR